MPPRERDRQQAVPAAGVEDAERPPAGEGADGTVGERQALAARGGHQG